jgi:hypothetical protein
VRLKLAFQHIVQTLTVQKQRSEIPIITFWKLQSESMNMAFAYIYFYQTNRKVTDNCEKDENVYKVTAMFIEGKLSAISKDL